MEAKTIVNLMVFVNFFVMPFLCVLSFANADWVKTDKCSWGLWRWENRTTSNLTNHEQSSISAQDSGAYFIACQTVSCISIVLLAAILFCVCCQKPPRKKLAVVLHICLVASTLTTLSVFGIHYKDDDRWRELNPSLSSSYWLHLVTAVLAFLCTFGNAKNALDERSEPVVHPYTTRRRTSSNASHITISKSKKIIIFRAEEYSDSNRILPKTSQLVSPVQEAGGLGGGACRTVTLPPYSVAPEPDSTLQEHRAPPCYEDIAKGAASSPSPVAVP